MKYTELNNGNIGNLLAGRYKFLENIKVRQEGSLFEVKGVWKTLLDDRCPWCGRKLKIGWLRDIVRCDSPRCVADPDFLTTKATYYRIKEDVEKFYKQ